MGYRATRGCSEAEIQHGNLVMLTMARQGLSKPDGDPDDETQHYPGLTSSGSPSQGARPKPPRSRAWTRFILMRGDGWAEARQSGGGTRTAKFGKDRAIPLSC